jgi:hypothetical protein
MMELINKSMTFIKIVMAANNNVETIETDDMVYVLYKKDGRYFIYENDLLIESFDTLRDSLDVYAGLRVYDEAPVTGCGTYTGRKYCELPARVRNQIYQLMRCE